MLAMTFYLIQIIPFFGLFSGLLIPDRYCLLYKAGFVMYQAIISAVLVAALCLIAPGVARGD